MDCTTSTAIDYDEIPTELREREQWVLWRYEMRDGKPNKNPYQTNGVDAKSNDPATWTTYDMVTTAYERGNYSGIGFVFAPSDPFVGIDLDGCRDPATGTIDQWATEIIEACDTFAEVSPSGTGVKLVGVGRSPFEKGRNQKLPQYGEHGGKAAGIEVYDHGRYFAVTGWRLPNADREPCVIQPAALELVKKLIDETKAATRTTATATTTATAKRPTNDDRARLVDRCRKYIDKMPAAISGQGGSNVAFNVACVCFRFGLTDGEALDVMGDYSARCEPPWSDHDLQHKLTDARDDVIRSGEFGSMTRDDKPQVQSLAAPATSSAQATDDDEQPPRPVPTIRTVRRLIEECPTMREPIIHGLLRRGETMNIIAPPKTGKSWLTIDLALAVATGREWLGFGTERGDVLIVDNELHGETSADRIPRVGSARGIPQDEYFDSVHIWNCRGQLVTIDHLQLDSMSIEPGRYRLIVLDALYRFIPSEADENSNAAMSGIYSTLDSMAARLDCAFVCIHHASKGAQGGKAVTDVGSGAGAQSRAADSHLVLRQHEQDGIVVLDAVCRSFAPIEPVCLRLDWPVFQVDHEADPSQLRQVSPPRRRNTTIDNPPEPEVKPWNYRRLAAELVGSFPESKATIEAKAVDLELTATSAAKLLQQAIGAGLVFEWPNPSDTRKKLYSTQRPPLVDQTTH